MVPRGLDGDGVYDKLGETPELTVEDAIECVREFHRVSDLEKLRTKYPAAFKGEAPALLLDNMVHDQRWFFSYLEKMIRKPYRHIPEWLLVGAWWITPPPFSWVFYTPLPGKYAVVFADKYSPHELPQYNPQTSCKMG